MKFKKFIIKGYRGISDTTEIDVSKESLIPIIGKNESGKTTCLEAINAFDYGNDDENNGKHLTNVINLYSTVDTPLSVGAELELGLNFNLEKLFHESLEEAKEEFDGLFPTRTFNPDTLEPSEAPKTFDLIRTYQLIKKSVISQAPILIERDLSTKKYSIPLLSDFLSPASADEFAVEILKDAPYILYFDDFRDRMDETLFITNDKTHVSYSRWILFIDELFKQTKEDYSVFTLATTQDSRRRSIISQAQKRLNEVLSEEWGKYQFDNKESIEIKIEYISDEDLPSLKFKIVEKVFINGIWEEYYFDISDRSKGFYWYFNFMIKLHFNPSKRHSSDIDTVYLLDEPGSYLHTYALTKLVEQLKRLSEKNKVIYCTHSHNLLHPDFVPINSIRIAEKKNEGKIVLHRINDNGIIRPVRNSAYQTILDALEVRPPMMEYEYDHIVLLEGIYDYYSFKMFASKGFSYFPCVSATSMIQQIPYMIFLGKNYLAVWDNDEQGRNQLEEAVNLFGEEESTKFLTLDILNNGKKVRLENYYVTEELELFKRDYIKLPDTTFTKAVLFLYYLSTRAAVVTKYFSKTKRNFESMENKFDQAFQKQKKII